MHEFDISEAAYARDKGAYVVVDKTSVPRPRPVKYVQAMPAKSAGKAVGKGATK